MQHNEPSANGGKPYVFGNRLLVRSPLGIMEIDAQGNSTPRYDQVSDQSIESMYLNGRGIGLMVMDQDVYLTRNGGRGFVKVSSPTSTALLKIGHVHSDSILMVAGGLGEIFRSADFGATWVQVLQAGNGNLEPSEFESHPSGFMVLKSISKSKVSLDHGRSFGFGDVLGAYNLRPDGLALVLDDGRVYRNNRAVITGSNPPTFGTIPPYFSVRGGS